MSFFGRADPAPTDIQKKTPKIGCLFYKSGDDLLSYNVASKRVKHQSREVWHSHTAWGANSRDCQIFKSMFVDGGSSQSREAQAKLVPRGVRLDAIAKRGGH